MEILSRSIAVYANTISPINNGQNLTYIDNKVSTYVIINKFYILEFCASDIVLKMDQCQTESESKRFSLVFGFVAQFICGFVEWRRMLFMMKSLTRITLGLTI